MDYHTYAYSICDVNSFAKLQTEFPITFFVHGMMCKNQLDYANILDRPVSKDCQFMENNRDK